MGCLSVAIVPPTPARPRDLVHVARGSAALPASACPPYALPTLTYRAGFRAQGHASVRTHEEIAW